MTVWDQLVQTAPEESRNVWWIKSGKTVGGWRMEVFPAVRLVREETEQTRLMVSIFGLRGRFFSNAEMT